MEYFAFQWHITEACDQRCKHCYIYALGSHAKFQAMALEDMVQVIENCQAFCRRAGRLPYFYLTGGDPILHPQFWQLAGLLKARGLPFAILGNPFHLTDDVCQKLRDHGCRKYQLSLDGLRETHDRIRRPGSYDETLAAIPLLQRAGIHVALMATVSKWNVQEIPALVDVAVEHQADIFAFARYCPSQADRDTTCSPLEYRALLGEVPGLRGRRVPNHLLPKGPPVDPLPLREGPVSHRRDLGPGHHLRRVQLRQLPYDHPLRRGGVRLPPDGEQGGQRPHRRPLRPFHRPGLRGLPPIRPV